MYSDSIPNYNLFEFILNSIMLYYQFRADEYLLIPIKEFPGIVLIDII